MYLMFRNKRCGPLSGGMSCNAAEGPCDPTTIGKLSNFPHSGFECPNGENTRGHFEDET